MMRKTNSRIENEIGWKKHIKAPFIALARESAISQLPCKSA